MEAFEIEEELDEALGGWVAFHHSGDVGAQIAAGLRLGSGRIVESVDDDALGDDVILQPRGDAVKDGGLEGAAVEDGVNEERGPVPEYGLEPLLPPGAGVLGLGLSRRHGERSGLSSIFRGAAMSVGGGGRAGGQSGSHN